MASVNTAEETRTTMESSTPSMGIGVEYDEGIIYACI